VVVDPDDMTSGPEEQADELRPVTALFADIVGSTALGERLSPAEVKALVGECVTRMSRVVEDFGGTVQAYMGDGICAYFGVPATHEDDPERAAQAALAIVAMLSGYGRDIRQAWDIARFDVRVGINSGPAGVGTVGSAHPQRVALGDMTNVAARLQAAADPGTIVVGEATAKHLSRWFVLEPLGELTLKGRVGPISAWRLLRRKAGDRELELSPLVGREAEMQAVRLAGDELLSGRGQVLLLVGEAGIGKSRLLDELRAIVGDRVTWLEGNCRAYGADALYWPLVEMLRTWLEVEEGEREIVVRTRLLARLSSSARGSDDVLPYLGHLLGVQLEPVTRDRLGGVPGDELAARLRAAFCTWIERLSEEAPVVLAIEDLHGADEATGALLPDLVALTDTAPVTLAITARSDPDTPASRFRAEATARFPHRVRELALGPIADDDALTLLEMIVPDVVDPHVRRELVARSEGNPLYVEELAHALRREDGRSRTWTLTVGPSLPQSLERLLLARIDRLGGDARALAQTAAVIGRVFPERVLARIAGPEACAAGLPELLRSGVIREIRRYPELEYGFRHGLLQEATRGTLTPIRQQAIYARAAGVFEELFADSLDERMEMLAYYHAHSGNMRKSLDYLERAGERAAALGQPGRAHRLWGRAIRIAESLPDADAMARLSRLVDGLPPPEDAGQPVPSAAPATPEEPGRASGGTQDGGDPDRGPAGEVYPRPGSRIGPYVIAERVTELGQPVRAHRDEYAVAMRLIAPAAAGPDARWERFVQRATVAEALDDVHLVPGLEFGEADGWRYVVLAWLPGGSLADRLAAGQGLPLVELARTIGHVALGLDTLHRQGLVHGDVRPACVLFDAAGHAAVTPIAMPLDGPRTEADEERVAPELGRGEPHSAATDIYALGALARCCLPPHARSLDPGAVPPSAPDTQALRGILWSIEQTRAADPNRRPRTAAMFAQMVRAAVRAAAGS
jgi:class 3 adenylate cyclase